MGLFDKLKKTAKDNADKVTDAVDKATDMVDDKTGGKYSEHLDKVDEKVKDVLEEDGK